MEQLIYRIMFFVHIILSFQDKDGDTALIEASLNGHIEIARVLLNYGANVDLQNKVSCST